MKEIFAFITFDPCLLLWDDFNRVLILQQPHQTEISYIIQCMHQVLFSLLPNHLPTQALPVGKQYELIKQQLSQINYEVLTLHCCLLCGNGSENMPCFTPCVHGCSCRSGVPSCQPIDWIQSPEPCHPGHGDITLLLSNFWTCGELHRPDSVALHTASGLRAQSQHMELNGGGTARGTWSWHGEGD